MPTDSNSLVPGDIVNALVNFTKNQEPHLILFLTAFVYLAGFFFIYRAVAELKQYGEMRSMMSSGTSLKAPLIYFFVGCLLIFYPSTINMGLTTIYNGTGITPYVANDGILPKSATTTIQALGFILRLIGYISFFRGWIVLTQLASQSSPPGTFWKGVTHIIGGILLVNIFATWDIVKGSFGY